MLYVPNEEVDQLTEPPNNSAFSLFSTAWKRLKESGIALQADPSFY